MTTPITKRAEEVLNDVMNWQKQANSLIRDLLAENEKLREAKPLKPFLDLFSDMPEGQWLPFTAQIKRDADNVDFMDMRVVLHKPRSGDDRRKRDTGRTTELVNGYWKVIEKPLPNRRTGPTDRRQT